MNRVTKIIVVLLAVGAGVYFLATHNTTTNKVPAKYQADNKAFTRSVLALAESRDLSQPPDSSSNAEFTLSKETEDKIDSLNNEGLALSKQVSDEYLNYLDPELKTMYRDKLIKGTEEWFEGMKENAQANTQTSVTKQIEGNKLIVEWIDWFDKKKDSLANKVF